MSALLSISDFDPEGPFAKLFLPFRLRKRQKETRFKQEWKLTASQYLAMMKEFKGPRKQRGIVIATAIFSGVEPLTGFVVLTTHSFDKNSFANVHESGVKFKTNGELAEARDEVEQTSISGEWWNEQPLTDIGDFHEMRSTSTIGTWNFKKPANDDVWINFVIDRYWEIQSTGPTDRTTSSVFEIGKSGEQSAEDSAFIQCSVTF